MNTNLLEGAACPKCKSEGPFTVGITMHGTATVDDDGWDDFRSESSDMDLNAPAKCLECGHSTNFIEFFEEEPTVETTGSDS